MTGMRASSQRRSNLKGEGINACGLCKMVDKSGLTRRYCQHKYSKSCICNVGSNWCFSKAEIQKL
ncbi:hypothetical protein [Candidatus Regiella insecticola]|uniref:hypothetical protein n=1 Tax=Candidatus Regiella insecticola TaxID=138073 RepID=UPI0002DA2DCF|nr:hypothetical protein [Candidatus Regiella insecticola]